MVLAANVLPFEALPRERDGWGWFGTRIFARTTFCTSSGIQALAVRLCHLTARYTWRVDGATGIASSSSCCANDVILRGRRLRIYAYSRTVFPEARILGKKVPKATIPAPLPRDSSKDHKGFLRVRQGKMHLIHRLQIFVARYHGKYSSSG